MCGGEPYIPDSSPLTTNGDESKAPQNFWFFGESRLSIYRNKSDNVDDFRYVREFSFKLDLV